MTMLTFALAFLVSSLSPATVRELEQLGARKASQTLYDYGSMAASAPAYWEIAPQSLPQARDAIAMAHRNDLPIRFRGRGHSMHGGALPDEDELLMSSANLLDYRFDQWGTVSVGSGASIQAVETMLRSHGYQLPVTNEGGLGPSVGGFISAGGIGNGAARNGGFWNNVVSVTLIDGTGRPREVTVHDAAFPWLFGSMGQLGLITEARLKIVPRAPMAVYPWGKRGRIAEIESPLADVQASVAQVAFGYTIFVPAEAAFAEMLVISALQALYPDAFFYRPVDVFPIAAGPVAPPLVYPYSQDAVALVSWGMLANLESARGLDQAIDITYKGRPRYRRYVQFEPAKDAYAGFFGPMIYNQFWAWKQHFDPKLLFNRGTVFAAPQN